MVETVAEFTTNHCGNLNVLLRMVDAAADAGATWIKMQKKDVDTFYSSDKLNGPFDSPYGKTYRDYRAIFEFERQDWERFADRCKERNIPWFCTVQDIPSLEFMLGFNLPRYKVASSNARNTPFLEEVARSVSRECEIVVSVGGSTLDEIEKTLHIFDGFSRVWLLHCVAEYPCPPERCRLGNIRELKRRYENNRVKVGYSGHEIGGLPKLAAVKLGASMVERHFCLSRHSFVHHVECSLMPEEFASLVNVVNDMRWYGAEGLPEDAYDTDFGMSDVERRFLVEQAYGNQYLGASSGF